MNSKVVTTKVTKLADGSKQVEVTKTKYRCRPVINRRIDRVKRMFRWATSQELVPVTVYQALRTLSGLQRPYRGSRTDARQTRRSG